VVRIKTQLTIAPHATAGVHGVCISDIIGPAQVRPGSYDHFTQPEMKTEKLRRGRRALLVLGYYHLARFGTLSVGLYFVKFG